MGVQIDLIVPPIIVGLLIILIFRMNSFIMESSVDTRLINDVQMQANVATDIIQEEIRGMNNNAITISQDTLRYSKFSEVSGVISSRDFMLVRDNNNGQLKIHFQNLATGNPDSLVYALNLSSLSFTSPQPHLLRVSVEAESKPEQHVRFRDDEQTVRAVSERDFFLRHRMFQNAAP
jgi:hypothetical protein